MSSITLFVVKPIPAVNGLPNRFRVTDVSLNGGSAVVLERDEPGQPIEVAAVLDYYHQVGGSDLVSGNDVTFHGVKGQESYFSI